MAILSRDEIAALTVEERFELVDEIYESFRTASVEPEPPEWHRKVLEERLREADASPELALPWEEAKAQLEKKWLR